MTIQRIEVRAVALSAIGIQQMVTDAGFMLDIHAMAYFDAMPLAERDYGQEGLKTQILYLCNNMKARTPEQKLVKKQLQQLAR